MSRAARPGVVETEPPDSLSGEEFARQAEAIVARYPNARSATLPLMFLVQSVEGYVTEEGMRRVAGILGLTPAQVLASVSFYTMLKRRPQGEYIVSVCRNITCTHLGATDVTAACRDRLGIEPGGTTGDGRFTLETAECLATCDGAPSLQVNYEDFLNVGPEEAVALIDRLAAGEEVLSARGERVQTHKQISHEVATTALRVPGGAGDHTARTIGGEAPRADTGPGFRPREPGRRSDADRG
jgi:NADH-quinone oxidoreductase subunit E